MYDDVLIPTDGSEAVDRALDHAIPLASDHDATVHALYVVDGRVLAANSGDLREAVAADLRSQGDTAVQAVADRAGAAGLDVETTVTQGTPDTEIVAYAASNDVDLVVLSPTGKSPRERIQSLGSVSDRVADDATVPVLLVK
jgi:nucleotide-binding universal stress UspA family protein